MVVNANIAKRFAEHRLQKMNEFEEKNQLPRGGGTTAGSVAEFENEDEGDKSSENEDETKSKGSGSFSPDYGLSELVASDCSEEAEEQEAGEGQPGRQ